MIANWVLLPGILATCGGLQVGIWRAERNPSYDPQFSKYSVWIGLVLLAVYAVLFFNWKSLIGL